jgi:hypothetical protein
MTTQQRTASGLTSRIGEGNLIAIGAVAGMIGRYFLLSGLSSKACSDMTNTIPSRKR